MVKSLFSRAVLALLCTCFSTLLFAQSKGDDGLLYWAQERRLTLNDFRGTRKIPDTIYIGSKRSTDPHRLGVILTAIDVQVKSDRNRTLFTVRAVMDKHRSWILNTGDRVSLKHEQGHFDICEMYTRVMRRELRKATSIDRSKVIYEEVLAAESAEHDAFDRENTFEKGGITKAWADKIARRLKQLQPFSDPTIILQGR